MLRFFFTLTAIAGLVAAQVLVGLYKELGADPFFKYLRIMFVYQEQFGNQQTYSLTARYVYSMFAELGPKANVSAITVDNILRNGKHNMATRTSWKYGTTRGVYGTPFFLVNGVAVKDEGMTFEKWKSIIYPLLTSD